MKLGEIVGIAALVAGLVMLAFGRDLGIIGLFVALYCLLKRESLCEIENNRPDF